MIRPAAETPLQRHVVLVSPDIPWNTGNIGRTCLGAGARLHLIRPLGFSMDDRDLKRAGLDYWKRLNPSVWEDYAAFEREMAPLPEEVAVFTKKGVRPFWFMPSPGRLFLIFGSETRGLPEILLTAYPESTYHIPISDAIRCLNLSTAVGIALYESLRPVAAGRRWIP